MLLLSALLSGYTAYGQTTLFEDDFEAGATNWTLNGGTGDNQWIVNNVYVSGLAPIIGDTPNQPVGITNGPNSSYLHIYSFLTCTFMSVCNATFDASTATNRTVQTANAIATTGYNTVTLSFYYLAAGDATEAYGTLEYSTDNTNWIPTGTNYVGVSTWTLETVSLPAWDNQAQLKFRFRWFNTDSGVGDDPAFSIDEVKVIGTPTTASNSIATGPITTTAYCESVATTISVPFTATGTMNAGNTYTAYLSDATGSFTTPTAIGTLSSTSNGAQTISATLPASTTPGTGYRIRVDASNPTITGTDNGTNIIVHASPGITLSANPTSGIICQGASAVLTASGGTTYSWTPTTNLDNTSGATVTANPSTTTPYTVTGTDANGCSATALFTVTVENCASISEVNMSSFEMYPNPVKNTLQIVFENKSEVKTMSILDMSGRTVAHSSVALDSWNVESLELGSYFLLLETTKSASIQKFVKE